MLQGVWRNGFTRSRNGSEQLWDGGAKTDSGAEKLCLEQGLSQNNRVGGRATQNDAQPIQDRNNPPVFDVSGPIRAGGSGSMVMRPVPPDQMQDSNPIEQFLATLNPAQRATVFSFASRATSKLMLVVALGVISSTQIQ
jgi:hypothetical protein